jgi:predicted MFS family arabinose efflux permease
VISNWFHAKRGKALGIAMTGTGLGAMLMVPVTSWLVVHWGWRTSYLIAGCIILSMVPVNLLFIRTRPSDLGLLPDGGVSAQAETPAAEGLGVPEAIRTQAFWMIGAMMVLAGVVAMGVGVHLMPYLTDIGHSEATASLIIASISGMTVIGKIGMGSIADRWGVRPAVALAFGLILIGILLLMGAGYLDRLRLRDRLRRRDRHSADRQSRAHRRAPGPSPLRCGVRDPDPAQHRRRRAGSGPHRPPL